MAKMMQMLALSTFLVILAQITVVEGLECYQCNFFKMESENSLLSAFLTAINAASNKQCKMEKGSDDYKGLQTRTCPTPSSGNEAKCVVVKGKTSTTTLSITVTVDTISRDCIEVPKGDSEYTDGCHDDLPSSANDLLDSVLSNANVADYTFSGEVCYYSTSLSKGSHTVVTSYVLLMLSTVYTLFQMI